jgi:sialate O-acetylesterase
MKMKLLFTALLMCALGAQAALTTGPLFTDNMVLQRDKPVVVWGTADAGEFVTVEFAGQQQTARTNGSNERSGEWQVTLDPMRASAEPQAMSIRSQASGLRFQLQAFPRPRRRGLVCGRSI